MEREGEKGREKEREGEGGIKKGTEREASVRAPGDSGHKVCLFKDRGVNVSKTHW